MWVVTMTSLLQIWRSTESATAPLLKILNLGSKVDYDQQHKNVRNNENSKHDNLAEVSFLFLGLVSGGFLGFKVFLHFLQLWLQFTNLLCYRRLTTDFLLNSAVSQSQPASLLVLLLLLLPDLSQSIHLWKLYSHSELVCDTHAHLTWFVIFH